MENIFKRMLYNSIGFASLASKKLEQTINDLLSEGKLSEEEGKRIMDNFSKATDRTKEDLERDMKDFVEQTMKRMNIPTRKEMRLLEERVAHLETFHGETPPAAGKAGTTDPNKKVIPPQDLPPTDVPPADMP